MHERHSFIYHLESYMTFVKLNSYELNHSAVWKTFSWITMKIRVCIVSSEQKNILRSLDQRLSL